jgi:hypothetical protein
VVPEPLALERGDAMATSDWRYPCINDTPQQFSFTVAFWRDGRVKDVTDVWGWD